MTRAPENLLAVRRLLLTELGPHGLDPWEVGVVGDTAHISQGDSYHLGLPEQRTSGYSVSESPRDTAGLCEYASALDVGTWSYGPHDLRTFSRWIVAQCVAGAADTRDIREVIYSPDGQTVKRWDRLGKRTTGDSSHLTHTHFSFFRDSTKAGRDLTPLFRRYLTSIGLLEDDMALDNADVMKVWTWDLRNGDGVDPAYVVLNRAAAEATKARLTGEAVLAAVKGLDTQAVLARIDQVAAEERQRDTELRDLVARYQSGTIDAAAVADELARRMAS